MDIIEPTQKCLDLLNEEARRRTAVYTVCFVQLTDSSEILSQRESHTLGSGVLSTVGSVKGFITAHHVAEELAKHIEVGVTIFGVNETKPRGMKISVANTDIVGFRPCGVYCPDGPDLAFVALNQDISGWLEALGAFLELDKHRHEWLKDEFNKGQAFSTITGVVDESTTLNLSPGRANISLTGMSLPVVISNHRIAGGFDLFNARPVHEAGQILPASFEGMSGGPAWYFLIDGREEVCQIMEHRLLGIAFYQTDMDEQGRSIICHGRQSIYDALVPEIQHRWPSTK